VTAVSEFIRVSWLFPVIQSVHIIGIVLLVGTIALVDLRLLGITLRRHAVASLVADLSPWTAAGLVTVFLTGPLLFWADLGRYLQNPAFLVKMILLAAAVVAHFTLHRGALIAPKRQRVAAVCSLVLWSSVILAGRAIADFDIRPT
jgi:hypothetical protein